MAESTWAERERPVLEAVYAAEELGGDAFALTAAAKNALPELDEGAAILTIRRLGDAGFLRIKATGAWGSQNVRVMVEGTTSAGLLAVGAWPSPASVVEAVIAAIEDQAEAEPEPERRGRLRKVASAISEAGREIVIEVGAAVVAKQVGG